MYKFCQNSCQNDEKSLPCSYSHTGKSPSVDAVILAASFSQFSVFHEESDLSYTRKEICACQYSSKV